MTELHQHYPQAFYVVFGFVLAMLAIIMTCIVGVYRLSNRPRKAGLPQGMVVESGAGLQCCCPTCEYGVWDQEMFIDGFSKIVKRTCSKCGTEYLSLTIASVPQSARHDW